MRFFPAIPGACVLFLLLFASNAAIAVPVAPPNVTCEASGGTWDMCVDVCGIANCADPKPDQSGPCPHCEESCICPATAPLWEPWEGGCITELECPGGTTGGGGPLPVLLAACKDDNGACALLADGVLDCECADGQSASIVLADPGFASDPEALCESYLVDMCPAVDDTDTGGSSGSTSGDESEESGDEAPSTTVDCSNEFGDCSASSNFHSCICEGGMGTGGEAGEEVWMSEEELLEWCEGYLEDMCGSGETGDETGDETGGGSSSDGCASTPLGSAFGSVALFLLGLAVLRRREQGASL